MLSNKQVKIGHNGGRKRTKKDQGFVRKEGSQRVMLEGGGEPFRKKDKGHPEKKIGGGGWLRSRAQSRLKDGRRRGTGGEPNKWNTHVARPQGIAE